MRIKLDGADLLAAHEAFKAGDSYLKIGKRYGVDPTTVMNRLRTLHGFAPRAVGGPRKHLVVEDYFDWIDTPEKAYFLGLLMADGYNLEGSMVALDMVDVELVAAFRDAVCPTRTLKILKRTRHRGQTIYACRVKSKRLSLSLANAGVRQKKSFTATYPKSVPDHLQSHFIRGLFDGDGSVFFSFCKNPGRYRKGNLRIVGTRAVLVRVRAELKSRLSVRSTIRPMKAVFELYVSGNCQIKRVRDWLYTLAGTFLSRKRDRLNSIQ